MSGWSDPQKGGRAVGAALYPTLSSLLSTAPQPGMRATASDAPGSMLYASGGKWAGDPGRFASDTDANYIAYLAAIAAGSVYPAPSILIGPTPATAAWDGSAYVRRGISTRKSVVANRGGVPYENTFGIAKQFMSRSGYNALTDLATWSIKFVNWSSNGDTESSGGQSATVKAAIEYPIGTIAQIVTFGGEQIGTMLAGGDIESDAITVNIPSGAKFAVRSFYDAPGGGAFFRDAPIAGIDGCDFGTTVTDVTYTASAITIPTNGITYHPALILGPSNKPCVLLVGDSRMAGTADLSDTGYGARGEILRGISYCTPAINIGSPGMTAKAYASTPAGFSKRSALVAGFYNYAISNLGINDVATSDTAATINANILAIADVVGVPVWQCTLPPKTTSSNAWATVANQTVDANNAKRVSVNGYIRNSMALFIEIADCVESAQNSGKWKADGSTANLYTTDGLHESQYANMQIDAASALRKFLAWITVQ